MAVAAAVFGALPFIADNYILRITTSMLMYSTLALSWNFIGGFAGYPSFATAAFFGLGAYASGVLQTKGVPMVAAWGVAGMIVIVFAAAVGRAILHLRGHYFAIATLVIADVLREVINGMTNLTGGGMGLNLPVLKIDVTAQAQLFYFAMLGDRAARACHVRDPRPQPHRLRLAVHRAERGCGAAVWASTLRATRPRRSRSRAFTPGSPARCTRPG